MVGMVGRIYTLFSVGGQEIFEVASRMDRISDRWYHGISFPSHS